MPDGPTHQSCSADEQCGFPVAEWCRSKAGGSCCQPLAGMVVVNRRHADSLGQSGRRKTVRRRGCRSARGENFGPADPHRRQVAQLAGRLLPTGATRLERLRGFGAALGTLATCACSRLDFADGGAGVLVVAMLSRASCSGSVPRSGSRPRTGKSARRCNRRPAHRLRLRRNSRPRPSRRPGISWSSHCPNRPFMRRSSRRISRMPRRWTDRHQTTSRPRPPARRRPNFH